MKNKERREKFLSHVRAHRSFILIEFQHVDDDSAERIETLGERQSEGPFAGLKRRWKTKDVKTHRQGKSFFSMWKKSSTKSKTKEKDICNLP